MSTTTGRVRIHGREYKTVALRVQEFREEHSAKEGWAILTEIIEKTDDYVIMKASILTDNGLIVATGHAEEQRKASQINATSYLENCETSAIGRALSAFGLCGSEYASANEVQNAIHQQAQLRRENVRGRGQPKPTKEEQEYIDNTLQVIAVADHTDLDNIANDLKGRSPIVRRSIEAAGASRRQFLKDHPDAQSQPAVEG